MPDYQKIEEIQVDNNPRGVFARAAIFSADFDVGIGSKPTKFIINLVNAAGVYDISANDYDENGNYTGNSDLSYIRSHNIRFIESGDHVPVNDVGVRERDILSFRFYLESFQVQRSAGKRILQVTFVDGSTLLDRIYVALGDTHQKIGEMSSWVANVQFPMLCETPEFFPIKTRGLIDVSQVSKMRLKHFWFDNSSVVREIILLLLS